MVLVKPRSREGSVSERLCNVWIDDARDELVIVYETVKKLCMESHLGRETMNGSYTQDVRVWLSVCVRVYPCVSSSTHRTSVAVHQYTYQHVGPWTQHADPSLHTIRPWVSASTHRTSVAVSGCPSAHTGSPWLSVCVRQHTQDVSGCPSVHISALWTFVGVRQHTQDIRSCPTAHTGRPWQSISTHISTLVLGLSTLTLPVDCLGDFGPSGLSVQYTQDVRGRLPAHTGRLWLSISTHRTSVAVRVCPCVAISIHRTSVAVHQYTYQHAGPSCGLFGPSVGVRQHTHDVCGCPSAHTGRLWLSVCVRVCPSAHTGRLWLSISTHISTLVLGLSTLTLLVDCSGDFGPRGLSVQYTQDVRGCPPAHTGRLWLSVSTHSTSVAVRVCLCVSVNTHRTPVAVHQYTYQHAGPWTQHAGPSRGLFGMFVGVAASNSAAEPEVDPTPYSTSQGANQDIRALKKPYLTNQEGLNHEDNFYGFYTQEGVQAIWNLPKIFTEQEVMNFTIQRFLSPSICEYATLEEDSCPKKRRPEPKPIIGEGLNHEDNFYGFYTQEGVQAIWNLPKIFTEQEVMNFTIQRFLSPSICEYATLEEDSSPKKRRPEPKPIIGVKRTSIIHLAHPESQPATVGVRQHTQDVRGCLSAHTGRPWLSVCVRQHTQDVHGCPLVHISARWPFPWTVRVNFAHVGCLFSTHRTSVGIRHHTQDVHVCPSAHIGCPWLSVCVRVCPSVHTGRPWLSISTHISTLVLGLSTLTLPVDCLGDFGPRGLSVQYTQDVRGCPPAHTGRPWVSVSTHRTTWLSMCVRVCPSAHTGRPWMSNSTHISTLVLGLSTLTLPVDCSSDFGHVVCLFSTHNTSVGVRQHTHDVRGCPWLSVSTHRKSGAVCVCPSAHTGRPWLSISTHISTFVLGLSTLTLPVDCLGRSWVSASTHMTSVAVHLHTQDFRGCPCVSDSTHRTFVAAISTHISTLALPVDCSGDFGPRALSIQYTQDVRGYPSAQTGRPCVSVSTHRTSVAVLVCPSAHTGHLWLSISTHINTLVLGLSTLALPMECSGDFGPRGLSVQCTQDVCGRPPAHTGRPWLSVSTHRTYVAVRVCLCVSISIHRTSVAVHQYTYQHVGPWTQHAGPSCGLFGTSVGVRQHTQDICGCPCVSVCVRLCLSAHTGRPCLSISTHISTLVLGLSTLTLPVGCSTDFGPRGLSVQYTQDVCGCPPAHTGRLWLSVSTHRTSVAIHQYTYQHAGPWTQHAGPSRGLFG
ncbi:hypothetical protein IGI04_042713 [Brassica rapa subsp. trilocularis]|uniref:Uncharacterized protein n=1 Tax=Brassica rapa subsp. trilocularis TaxID=1813537 RepID=A0ABQ7KJ78_BRACM|nr:hypothetical protein IGI04_042713 [Brassica rapa subsp. trilocularis]